MDLAIGTTFDYTVPLEAQMQALHKTAFSAVSLGANLGHCDYLKTAVQAEIRTMALRSEMALDSIHVPIAANYDISRSDPETRMAAVLRVALVMAAAVELGIETVILHLCHFDPRGYEQNLDALLASLDVLLESAENMGIRLAGENLVTEPSHTFLEESLQAFSTEHYGLCFDSSHAHISGRPPFEWLERFGDRLLAVHLSDNDGKEDRHWIPFTGIVDWETLAKHLKDFDLNKSLLLEVENRDETPTPEFLAKAEVAALRLRDMILG